MENDSINKGSIALLIKGTLDNNTIALLREISDNPEIKYLGRNEIPTTAALTIYERRYHYEDFRKEHIKGYEALMPSLQKYSEPNLLLVQYGNNHKNILLFTDLNFSSLIGALEVNLDILSNLRSKFDKLNG